MTEKSFRTYFLNLPGYTQQVKYYEESVHEKAAKTFHLFEEMQAAGYFDTKSEPYVTLREFIKNFKSDLQVFQIQCQGYHLEVDELRVKPQVTLAEMEDLEEFTCSLGMAYWGMREKHMTLWAKVNRFLLSVNRVSNINKLQEGKK